MGTNYYAVLEANKCECCDRSDKYKIHLGKKSCGWNFSFQGFKSGEFSHDWPNNFSRADLTSWKEWRQFLRMGIMVLSDGGVPTTYSIIILDEYGEEISLEELDRVVDSQRDGLVHNTEILKDRRYSNIWAEYSDPNKFWLDDEGFSFTTTEFS